jgi:hypothetical protein
MTGAHHHAWLRFFFVAVAVSTQGLALEPRPSPDSYFNVNAAVPGDPGEEILKEKLRSCRRPCFPPGTETWSDVRE